MSFAEQVTRQQDVVFRTFGEDAIWPGIAGIVRVRHRRQDDDSRFQTTDTITTTNFVRVRRSEVASPALGQVVELLAGPKLKVIGEPTIDRKDVWTCPVRELPA
jgi:hypothetical protein